MSMRALEKALSGVEKPSRYTGGEWNIIQKQGAKVQVALCFPDVYEIGMSHLGSRILYQVLNDMEQVYCQRVFAPWTDMEQAMREQHIPLYALETKMPVADFDIVGFSLLYEMGYTNILTMLELAGIPFLAAQRGENHPLILCGGPSACNAEPLADIVDAVLLGDGEEVFPEVLDMYTRMRGAGKKELLLALSRIPGVYVPGFYEAVYQEGHFTGLKKLEAQAPLTVQRRVLEDLCAVPMLKAPIVPNLGIVHDRAALELFRGCTRGCRFCQAGYIYRPVRERSMQTLLTNARTLIGATGYDEMSLFSLSSSDYSCIHALIPALLDETEAQRVSLSLPSLRIDTFLGEELARMQAVRKAGLTFAPEAGSQRLRDVINKGVREEDLLKSAQDAFEAGWTSMKLYFMIGLPTETDEDVLGIAQLARKVSRLFYALPKERRGKGLRLSVSVSSFVPKPFTPFQWAAQNTMDELRRKQRLLGGALRGIRGVEYKYHDSSISMLEAAFSRGDRRLGQVLIEAYKRGCRFDSWAEHFKPDAWEAAFLACGIDVAYYANRERALTEALPWDHVDIQVKKAFLVEEYEKSRQEAVTKDCRLGCNQCFEVESPLRAACFICGAAPAPQEEAHARHLPLSPGEVRIIARFTKGEEARFTSHLDVQRLMQRAMRRAKLPVKYSQGFNPHPLLAFASALALGYTSDAEWLDVRLEQEVTPEAFVERLNPMLPPGVRVLHAKTIEASLPTLTALLTSAQYQIDISFETLVERAIMEDAVSRFLAGSILVEKRTKGGLRQVDMRPHLCAMTVGDVQQNRATLLINSVLNAAGGLQVELVMQAFMQLLQPAKGSWRVHRTRVEFEQIEV